MFGVPHLLMGPLSGGAAGIVLAHTNTVTSQDSSTIQVPGTVNNGDIGVVMHSTITGGSGSDQAQAPSGWTQAVHNSGTYHKFSAHHKVLATGDRNANLSINYSSGGSSDTTGAVLFVFSTGVGSPILTALDVEQSIQTSGGDPAAITMNASGETDPVIIFAFGAGWNGASPSFTTQSPAFDATAGTEIVAGYKIYNASPSNLTADIGRITTSYENLLAGFYLRVTE